MRPAPEAVAVVKPWQLRIGKTVLVMGIDADAMLTMANAGTGRSMVTEQIMERVLNGKFAFGGGLNMPMWAIEQAARVWRFAMTQGGGAEDVTAIARVMESWAGVEIRRRTTM